MNQPDLVTDEKINDPAIIAYAEYGNKAMMLHYWKDKPGHVVICAGLVKQIKGTIYHNIRWSLYPTPDIESAKDRFKELEQIWLLKDD